MHNAGKVLLHQTGRPRQKRENIIVYDHHVQGKTIQVLTNVLKVTIHQRTVLWFSLALSGGLWKRDASSTWFRYYTHTLTACTYIYIHIYIRT